MLLFLEGGNDGLNTVVPVEADAYHRARPRLALSGDALHPLDDLRALHPSLGAWVRLFDEGRLAILPSVGMERPDRSHFVSRDIWHCGRRELPNRPTGWVGRALDAAGADQLPGVALGVAEAPLILAGERRFGLTLQDAGRLSLEGPARDALPELVAADSAIAAPADPAARIGQVAAAAYELSDRLEALLALAPAGTGYPDTALADRLRLAARLVRARGGPPVMWCTLGGFDTHAVQAGTHAALLDQLGTASAAFLDDLATDGCDRRTLLLVYSEFGRRVAENGSGGTDHGAAAPVFALGGEIHGGLHGGPPDLEALVDGDVRAQVDFRCVFAEAASWMGWDAPALFGSTEPVGFLA